MVNLVMQQEPDPILARDRRHLLWPAHEVDVRVQLLVRGCADQIAEILVHLLECGQELIPILGRLRSSCATLRRAAGVLVVPDLCAEAALEDEDEGQFFGGLQLRMGTEIELVRRIRLQHAHRLRMLFIVGIEELLFAF